MHIVKGLQLGLHAVAVRTGLANGVPLGVQVLGNRYREDLSLDAAEAIEMLNCPHLI